MATNLAIDPDLLERALAIGGERTKKATVTKALEEYIQRRAQPKIRASRGQFDDWDPTFDYKASRRARDRKLGLTGCAQPWPIPAHGRATSAAT